MTDLAILLDDLNSGKIKLCGETGARLLIREAHARGMQIADRYMVTAKKQTLRKKATKLQGGGEKLISEFQSALVAVRRELKHVHVKVLKPTDALYGVLTDVAELGDEFCKKFALNRREGFMEFCRIGVKLMGKKYALNKFMYNAEKIFVTAEVERLVKDADQSKSERMYREWRRCMEEYANFVYEVNSDSDFVNFIYAYREADKVKADYGDWMQAQFEGLAWMNTVPELEQLHTDNAHKRYVAYKSFISMTEEEEVSDAFKSKQEEYWKIVKRLK
jgi:hypothetical protein